MLFCETKKTITFNRSSSQLETFRLWSRGKTNAVPRTRQPYALSATLSACAGAGAWQALCWTGSPSKWNQVDGGRNLAPVDKEWIDIWWHRRICIYTIGLVFIYHIYVYIPFMIGFQPSQNGTGFCSTLTLSPKYGCVPQCNVARWFQCSNRFPTPKPKGLNLDFGNLPPKDTIRHNKQYY